jgi:hypothetical protein
MGNIDLDRQIEADRLAEANAMVTRIVRDWDWITWNELLAEDVVLTLKLQAVGLASIDSFNEDGTQISGRNDARKAMKSIYGELKNGVSITTEVVNGYDFAVFGALRVSANGDLKSYPFATFVRFNPEEFIQEMTIATIDVDPLYESIRDALQRGANKPNGVASKEVEKTT